MLERLSATEPGELLFPALDGGFLNEHALRKPFEVVGQLLGLKIRLTPRGMRRSFNDAARLANVEALVTRSISGHATERMRAHYSTVQPVEQRTSIGRVLRLVHGGAGNADAPEGGAPGGAPGASGAPEVSSRTK